ncbi:MAG: sulfurtransferase TusA family protein [Pseudodonghicola sp.]
MDDENAQIEIAETVDALGLLCPLPVLRARKRLQALAPGAVLRLLASDPAAVIDVPHFCNQSGHALLGGEELDGHLAYLIRTAL